MKRVLVTGARSPAALELIRSLGKAGFEVFAADCLRFPVARWSKYVSRYFRLPSPVKDLEAFEAALKRITSSECIDLLIPTCEEVFHISRIKGSLPSSCQVFCDDFEKLDTMHNKFSFSDSAKGLSVGVPKTDLLLSRTDKILSLYMSGKYGERVLKRAYSRFATAVYIKPNHPSVVAHVEPSKGDPWVAQDYIKGTELCCYSIAVHGVLKALAIYEPVYRAGQGAGIWFQPVRDPKIETFVAAYIDKHDFHGQISFDFIKRDDGEVFVIECNPRATSGIHLLAGDAWPQILQGEVSDVVHAGTDPKMVGIAMLTYGRKSAAGASEWTRDFRTAKDVIWDKADMKPVVGQVVAMGEIVLNSVRNGTGLLEGSTADIEWNGEI